MKRGGGIGAGLAAAVLGLSLTACAYTPKLISSPSGDSLPGAIDQQRFEKILAQTQAVVESGDAARDWQRLAPRVTGPALSMRNGEYVTANTVAGASLASLPLSKPQAMVVGQAGAWPRYSRITSY